MKTVLALFIALTSTATMADQFYVTVGLECNQPQSELVVWFHGAWNEAGERAVLSLGENGWDPRKLVSFNQNAEGKYSIGMKTENRACPLGRQNYMIEITPLLAPRFHPEGYCATRVGATATVKLNGRIVARRGVDACTETGRVTTAIIIRPKQTPRYQTVTAETFYGG